MLGGEEDEGAGRMQPHGESGVHGWPAAQAGLVPLLGLEVNTSSLTSFSNHFFFKAVC